MKRMICGVIFGIGFFLMVGLVGGVDCGEPLSNMLWCIPCAVAMIVSAIVGEFDKY